MNIILPNIFQTSYCVLSTQVRICTIGLMQGKNEMICARKEKSSKLFIVIYTEEGFKETSPLWVVVGSYALHTNHLPVGFR